MGFLLNGTTVQEFAFSGAAIIPNLDSIAEFRIVTNNFDAEYGNYAGGQINVITKSGANRFHGSVFEFLRNTAFDGTNYFSSKKDDHKQNEFGGTIGGPIKRDKMFFFADYQGNRVILGQSGGTGLIHVPSAAERNGDFTAVADSLTGVVQGPAWAQDLSTTSGICGDARRALLLFGLHHCNLRLSRRSDSQQRIYHAFQEPVAIRSSSQQRRDRFLSYRGCRQISPITRPAVAWTTVPTWDCSPPIISLTSIARASRTYFFRVLAVTSPAVPRS